MIERYIDRRNLQTTQTTTRSLNKRQLVHREWPKYYVQTHESRTMDRFDEDGCIACGIVN